MSKGRDVIGKTGEAWAMRKQSLYLRPHLVDMEQGLIAGKTSKVDMAMTVKNDELDPEWIELMQTARNIGISIEEVRQFLSDGSIVKASDLPR